MALLVFLAAYLPQSSLVALTKCVLAESRFTSANLVLLYLQ